MSNVNSSMSNVSFVFWGTDDFSVTVLETLKQNSFLPSLIITNPDRPKGRKLVLTPPPVKIWAEENNIPVLQPEKFDSEFIHKLKTVNYQLFLVASYGKIIPKQIIDLPEYKSLNIHPSLLSKLRGSSPIQETILQNESPGVTIMRMNEKMDQGPIIAQKKTEILNWPIPASQLNKLLAQAGAKLFSEIISDYLSGKIKPVAQNDNEATYTKMIKKTDGLIDLSNNPEINSRKILAYDIWPRAYFLTKYKEREIKVIITSAKLESGKLVIEKVIPEGKKEMGYEDFKRGSI